MSQDKVSTPLVTLTSSSTVPYLRTILVQSSDLSYFKISQLRLKRHELFVTEVELFHISLVKYKHQHFHSTQTIRWEFHLNKE